MILRRFALLIALLTGLAVTQLPEFVQQYRQALNGAVNELSRIVSIFDANGMQIGLNQAQAIDLKRNSKDRVTRLEGEQMEDNIKRLQSLRDAQIEFRKEGTMAQIFTFARHYDGVVSQGVLSDFQPAIPTTPEALGLGLFGFIVGGGVVHMTGRPLRRRVREGRGEISTTT